ncbi:MAG: hypothetical protein MJA32_06720 [Proteobacteria bacterium]|nr:hypothetical protein [Pseudomonadota bacterium]
MGSTIAVASVLLALIAAGCIIYIAWELTSKENLPDRPEEPARDDND